MDDTNDLSRTSTPNPRFTSQAHAVEDTLKEQTYGLVHLSDFRKRRAEAFEQTERASKDGTPISSGAATPDGREPNTNPVIKKRKKAVKKGGLSFGDDDEEGQDSSKAPTPAKEASVPPTDSDSTAQKRRLKPNTSVTNAPKALTKGALAREQQLRDALRKEYTLLQNAVKATEILVPFTFFDGKATPGGVCRMKKGDHIWLFLERARKVGAGGGDRSRRDWARIGVDDLMVVKGDLIVPHHYDFHYFILNRTVGYDKQILFDYSAEPTAATPSHLLPSKDTSSGASTPQLSDPSLDPESLFSTSTSRAAAAAQAIPDSGLEGYDADPTATKVVDRRWYERNKHIYPASVWEDFEPDKDYTTASRKDALGNAFFFSGR